MNCIWILLLLFCCGNGNGSCGRNRCNNNCGWNRCGDNCGWNRCDDNCGWDRCDNGCGCDRDDDRNSRCENICEAVCEAACDAVNTTNDSDCNCGRKTFPFTSYPVLNNCD